MLEKIDFIICIVLKTELPNTRVHSIIICCSVVVRVIYVLYVIWTA